MGQDLQPYTVQLASQTLCPLGGGVRAAGSQTCRWGHPLCVAVGQSPMTQALTQAAARQSPPLRAASAMGARHVAAQALDARWCQAHARHVGMLVVLSQEPRAVPRGMSGGGVMA